MEKIYVIVLAPSRSCIRYFTDPIVFGDLIWRSPYHILGKEFKNRDWRWTTRFDEALQINDLEFAHRIAEQVKRKSQAMELTDELINQIDYINSTGRLWYD